MADTVTLPRDVAERALVHIGQAANLPVMDGPLGPITRARNDIAAIKQALSASTQPAPAFPREEVADLIARYVSGPNIAMGYADAAEHRRDQLEAADAIAALLQGKQP